MRRTIAVLMILLLAVNFAPVARAVPLGVVGPSLSAGFLSGPVAPIVFIAGLITTAIILEYPQIQDALTTVFNTALPSPQPDQEMPGPPGSPSLLEDLQSRNPGAPTIKALSRNQALLGEVTEEEQLLTIAPRSLKMWTNPFKIRLTRRE